MRKLLPFLILLVAGYAKATTTLTINVTSLTGGTSPGNSVRIDLQNCAGARVIGTGQIVAQSQTVFPIGGVVTVTLYDNQQIDCGGGKAISYYSFNYIFQGTIISIGSYNLPPGTFTLSNLSPCVGSACIGAGSTTVDRIVAGTNITISPTTGLGTVTINSTGGGGAGNPALPFSSCQFNNSGVFGGGPGCTLDNLGNIRTLSNDGFLNAYMSQSTPTSNNGIQNALSSTQHYVVANPDYGCTEGAYSGSPNYRLDIGRPAPFADGTMLVDNRQQCGSLGTYIYNILPSTFGGFWRYDRIVSNHLPQTAGGGSPSFPYLSDWEQSGSGINGFTANSGPDSSGLYQMNFEWMRRGIVSAFNIEEQAFALGDNHVWQNTITNNRGTPDGSAEAFNTIRNQINNDARGAWTHATSTLAAGATLIPGTLGGNVPFMGDGTYYLDQNKAGPIFHITALTDPGQGCNAGTWTTDGAALTPDNIGCSGFDLSNIPLLRYGATTNATVTITGLSAPLVTTSTACFSDSQYQESARIVSAGTFSGGVQTIVAALRYPHGGAGVGNGFYVSQGSHACNVVEGRANQAPDGGGNPPRRQVFRLIGASAAHTMLYSRTVAGRWTQAPDRNSFFSPSVVANAGVTLTRASNVVTVAVTDPLQFFSGNLISVTGCSDPSFNATFTIATDTGTAVTWPNTGANGTTTCTNPVELLSRMSGTGVREAQEFPAVEIVNTNDPVTFALNYNITVEPNTNFQVTSGDVLENQVYSDVNQGLDHSVMNFVTQTASSNADIIHFEQFTGLIPPAGIWTNVQYNDSPTNYRGIGGTKLIAQTLFEMNQNTMPFNKLWDGLPAPASSAFTFQNCLFGCTDARSQFLWLGIPVANNQSWTETIHQDTGMMRYAVSSATANYFKEMSPAGDVTLVDAGAPGRAFVIVQPDLVSLIAGKPSTATATMNLTDLGLSVNVPITVPSCIGCGAPLTGSVTTTAATTDLVTITGMTASGHCAAPGPTNAAAGTMIQNATPVFIDTFTTNAITIHHVATAGATFSFVCTAN